MASTREIRRRIRSVKNTSQITRAMEMVAAVKMRRAQAQALASRPYAERMSDLTRGLAGHVAEEVAHPLLQIRPVRRIGLILFTSDRGLCGPINANAIREAMTFTIEQQVPVELITVGRRGRDWLVRRGREIVAEFSNIGDRPTLLGTMPIARLVMDGYETGRFDKVALVYNKFVSTTRQVVGPPSVLLPIEPAKNRREFFTDYIYEPNPREVLGQLVPRFVEVQIYQIVLEALASEQSARMVAMHNATQNAQELIESLTLSYNRARQTSITSEILEIAAGAEALQGR